MATILASGDWTLAQRNALRAAIVSGVTRVSYGDKSVEYRSLAEMYRVLADIESFLLGRTPRRSIRITTQADKGL